jgi:hypothetical protein
MRAKFPSIWWAINRIISKKEYCKSCFGDHILHHLASGFNPTVLDQNSRVHALQPICKDEHQMFCHGICKVNSNQVIWSSQHKYFCDVQPKHVKYYTSQIILISNQNMWSSHHKFLWSPTETFEVHVIFFCDLQLSHLISHHNFLHYPQDSGHVVELSWSAFQGGEWHTPTPFLLGYQPLHPSSPLISIWINLLLDDLWHNKVERVMFAPTHSLGSWVVHHGQFIDQLPPSHGNRGKIVSRMDKGFCHVRLETQG